MSADQLRRAAQLLRDTATACEQGAWMAEAGDKGHAWINLPAYHHAWGMHGFTEEARYVALMHPPVALALAGLLERTAAVMKDVGDATPLAARVYAPDIAMARAVLREES